LYIALGSLAELETQIILSEELMFLKKEQSKDIQDNINEINNNDYRANQMSLTVHCSLTTIHCLEGL
jgi:hypothetical protein